MFDKQINSDNDYNIKSSNIKDSLHEFSQIIQDFNKINTKEIGPTTNNINKYILDDGDLSFIINKLVDIIFNEINEGRDEKLIKKHSLNFINNHKIDLPELYNWLLNNQNNSDFMYIFGYLNYHGIGTNFNKQKAIELYQKAAQLENSIAQFNLANMYIHGNGVDKDYNLAFELTKKLAGKEIPIAIDKLGHCYYNGIGTDINNQKAFELFQKATDLGNSTGMNDLGYCYYSGTGTVVDKQKGYELYKKAANMDHYIAQFNLAYMYEIGNGVKKDIDQAIYWYKKSAEKGYYYAQNKLKILSGK
jgi:TPR repeat protein